MGDRLIFVLFISQIFLLILQIICVCFGASPIPMVSTIAFVIISGFLWYDSKRR